MRPPTDAEVSRVMETLGLDRVQAYRHAKQRLAIEAEHKRNRRAALTECAPPAGGAGRLDSPPEPPPATFLEERLA